MDSLILVGWVAAILIGITLALIGAGGSILTVPVLVYLFGIPPVLATAYSLFVVGLTALAGSASLIRKGSIRLSLVAMFAVPSLIAVWLTRAWLLPSIPDPIWQVGSVVVGKDSFILILFAALMLAASVSMIRNSNQVPSEPGTINLWIIALEGTAVGALTGLVGAGGGFLIIPVLVLAAGLSMTEAVGTSLVIIAIKSLIGFTGDLGHQPIDWMFLATFSLLPLAGMAIGQRLVPYFNSQHLKKAFGYFVLLTGSVMILVELIRVG